VTDPELSRGSPGRFDVEPAAEANPTAMTLRWIDRAGVRLHDSSDLSALLDRTDGFCWLDRPVSSDDAERLLQDDLHCHPLAIKDSKERNHIPRMHLYPDRLFIVVHAPEIGRGGHVHYLELDQFIGQKFLVTIHGPLNPVVPIETALSETRQVADRLHAGRLKPHLTVRPDLCHRIGDRTTGVGVGG
jgi:magnesium transporter